ncbi:aminotransferase class IV [Iningainema sp. BLCCT55]|uniref:Aminotransferase class IV n=1 Tax=Iningainema tapete BLCC-T55 TaxID=2748662 RepID=A0A8J7C8X5_9CYAN|nr:aminotransferase class IV [Iningainema tapete BLCC-T55]
MFWYDGRLIQSQTLEIDISNPGLLYGATVFTTLRVYGNSLEHRLTNWYSHCDRLQHSLQTFAWQQPDWGRVREGAQIIMAHFPVLRITIFPDGREWITGRVLPVDLTEQQNNGIIAAFAPPEFYRCLPSHKTGNYLSTWLARANVQQVGATEAILVDCQGNWLETSTGNLWGWRDGCWWTPPLTAGILPGVVRAQLLQWLLDRQQQVREEPWTAELVLGFEAIAISNSVVEAVPIHTVVQPLGQLEYNPHHKCFSQIRDYFL